jgi:hypothetical protein
VNISSCSQLCRLAPGPAPTPPPTPPGPPSPTPPPSVPFPDLYLCEIVGPDLLKDRQCVRTPYNVYGSVNRTECSLICKPPRPHLQTPKQPMVQHSTTPRAISTVCNTSAFVHPIQGVSCRGLLQPKAATAATSASQCAQICCLSASCLSWVWSNTTQPTKACWMGDIPCAGPQGHTWYGKSRVPVNPPAPAPTPPPGPAPRPACNGTGPLAYSLYDIHCSGLTESDIKTAVECKAACCASTTCQTWQFDPTSINGTCWNGAISCSGGWEPGWFGSSKLPPPAPTPTAAPRPTPVPKTKQCTWIQNVDYYGLNNSKRRVPATTKEDCCEACQQPANQPCDFAVFNAGGSCWLKTKGAIMGTKNGDVGCCPSGALGCHGRHAPPAGSPSTWGTRD